MGGGNGSIVMMMMTGGMVGRNMNTSLELSVLMNIINPILVTLD